MKKLQSTREEVNRRVAEATRLKGEGLKPAQIAERMGLPKTTVSYYLYKHTSPSFVKRNTSLRVGRPMGGVVSVLGATATTMNGTSHHEWFVAGYLVRYAQAHDLSVLGLVEDVKNVLKEVK